MFQSGPLSLVGPVAAISTENEHFPGAAIVPAGIVAPAIPTVVPPAVAATVPPQVVAVLGGVAITTVQPESVGNVSESAALV